MSKAAKWLSSDAELRVHHPDQVVRLGRHPIDAPADRQRRDAAEGEHDQREAPDAGTAARCARGRACRRRAGRRTGCRRTTATGLPRSTRRAPALPRSRARSRSGPAEPQAGRLEPDRRAHLEACPVRLPPMTHEPQSSWTSTSPGQRSRSDDWQPSRRWIIVPEVAAWRDLVELPTTGRRSGRAGGQR